MPTASPQPENQTLAELCGRGRPRSVILRLFQEGTVRGLLVGCAMFSILITTLIIGILAYETARFLQDVSVVDFLTGLEWNPLLGAERHFGIWPLIVGTLLVTLVAAVFAHNSAASASFAATCRKDLTHAWEFRTAGLSSWCHARKAATCSWRAGSCVRSWCL